MDDATPSQFVEWRRFLREHPPGTRAKVERAACAREGSYVEVRHSELELFCGAACQENHPCKPAVIACGELFGEQDQNRSSALGPNYATPGNPWDAILVYRCERCSATAKCYLLRFWVIDTKPSSIPCDVEKIAEWPPFSPRTPAKIISLVGPDRDLFLKGRRAEIEGLGLGAFSYYRRVVENQKSRLLSETVRVARHLHVDESIIASIELAKEEQQFQKAMDQVKNVIPPRLFIRGRNPFTLLHRALSQGIHEMSDDVCLQLAHDVRVVLMEFSEALEDALKDQKELDSAIKRLDSLNRS